MDDVIDFPGNKNSAIPSLTTTYVHSYQIEWVAW